MTLFEKFKKAYEQCFVPIFVKDQFDTNTLLEGCKLAGVSVIEYTLRREDAHKVIPTLKTNYPDNILFVGSTIDDDNIIKQMRNKHSQLMTIEELAPYTDGFVSMLPYSNETLEQYCNTHILIPTAETSGEALRQIKNGATMIKVIGPDFSFSKKLHALPTFNYCPTFITGGVTVERMEEVFEAGNIMCAAGFDLILKDQNPKTLTKEIVAQKLSEFISAAKEQRILAFPELKNIANMSSEEFIKVIPNYCGLI